MPGLGDYVCDISLTTRRHRLIDDLQAGGLSLDTGRYHRAIATGGIPEPDLATALEAALSILQHHDRRATAHLARFWGLRQDQALALVYSAGDDGLLVDRAPLIHASAALADRLTRAAPSYHTMIAQANIAHQVAKATGAAPAEARRPPVDRPSALAFRSATMGLLIDTDDPDTARHYNRTVADSPALALVETWMFPSYTRDIRPTPDLSPPRGVLLRHTAAEILREIDCYSDAYLDYLVATGIPTVLRRDPTFGLRAAELRTTLTVRLQSRATSPPSTTALLDSLQGWDR